MVLSRLKKRVSEIYPILGIRKRYSLNTLVKIVAHYLRLSKGRPYSRQDNWFYSAIISRREIGFTQIPKEIDKVIEYLRNAWWMEEEDILQEILFSLYIIKNNTIKMFLTHRLVSFFLSRQGLFTQDKERNALFYGGQEDYYLMEENDNIFLDKLFEKDSDENNLSLYNKYVTYLLSNDFTINNICLSTFTSKTKVLNNIRRQYENTKNAK